VAGPGPPQALPNPSAAGPLPALAAGGPGGNTGLTHPLEKARRDSPGR